MAWPNCGRILGRNLRVAAGNVSRSRDTTDVWKISLAGRSVVNRDRVFHSDATGNPLYSKQCSSSGSVCDSANYDQSTTVPRLIVHGCRSETRIAGGLRYGQPTFPQAIAGYSGNKLLHSSSVESEPSAGTARASDAASSHYDDNVEMLQHPSGSAVSREAILQMEDPRILYSGITSKELMATLCNLQLVSFEPMVDLSIKVLTSRLMKLPVTSIPLLWLVKRTAYSHFCAGEDAQEAAVTLTRLWEIGIRGVLDYNLEDAEDNESCDHNSAGFLNTIHQTRSLPEGSVSFACVKISAICPISLLERVSNLLRWQHKNPEYKLTWKQDGLPILAVESPTYQTQKEPEALSLEEERDLLKAQLRLRQLCEACTSNDLPILVDAEYSSIQPAIDYITYSAAFEFNKSERPIVYITLQTYLKDAPSRLSLALTESSRHNVPLALKLVRGAYITRESSLAASLGAVSPIHSSINATHECYNYCASVMLDRIASGNSAVVLATHNIDSGRFAALRANELGLDRADPRVQFAQLKGMADSLSIALVQAGFRVSKYVPFGPVAHVIPYLVRRADENRGLLGNSLADRRLLRKELGRRLTSAVGLKGFA